MKVIDKSVYTFSKENEVFLEAKVDEILLFKTLDCFGGQITSEKQLVHELDLTTANPAAGPVFIKGAEVGDVIFVDILDIKVADKGFACSMTGSGPLADISEVRTKVIEIENNIAKFNDLKWTIEPMIGVMGTVPTEGSIPCGFAGNYGGNMDSKIIKKGARVYFPVRVEGALLQMGDIHASMGDGELCGTGIEISGEIIARVGLIKNFELNWPVTETKDHWYVNATGKDYDSSLISACKELNRLMKPVYDWDTTDNFIYLSIQGDAEINQAARPMHDDMINIRVGIPKLESKKPLIL